MIDLKKTCLLMEIPRYARNDVLLITMGQTCEEPEFTFFSLLCYSCSALYRRGETMLSYDSLKIRLMNEQHYWLVTGVAGFIGSHLLETLLKLNQRVVGLDNFSTGYQKNLDDVKHLVSIEQWNNFTFCQGDIQNSETCRAVCEGVEFILHQAALGSVPRSIDDPAKTNANNITGFLNMLIAARDAKVKRFVYAASSSTYGDHTALPKVEHQIGKPLSPYAVTKYVNELYADVFSRCYQFNSIGLRYFNVFGPRQNPNGSYAAVIPKWILSLLNQETATINGDGETSRDFCYVENAVQANLLAALTTNTDALNQIYNVAVGERTSLKTLYAILEKSVHERFPMTTFLSPQYAPTRQGDTRHTLANIEKARQLLHYNPTHRIQEGIQHTIDWYASQYHHA